MNDMLIHAISAELLKLKHSKILLPALGLPLLGLLIGSLNYSVNRDVFSIPQWQAYWTQAALFYGYFFYPILLSACSSYLWRMEHRNHNWNSLMTSPLPVGSIFFTKFFIMAIIGLLVQVFLIVSYFLTGILILHFTEPFPLEMAVSWIFYGWVAALSVSAFQLYLSMRIRSFAVPVGICLCCCIVGLGLYAIGIRVIVPNSLVILGVGSAEAMGITLENGLVIIGVSILYICLFFLMAVHYLKKTDISAA